MTRWAITADLNRCVGCQTCTAACKHANATLRDIQWRKVIDIEAGEFPDVRRSFMPVGCMQCEDAPCLDVCPSTATRKRDDGIVTIDYDMCIGCGYCILACPYQARSKVTKPRTAYGGKAMRHEKQREDPARIGVAQKCTFCVDRIDYGLENGLTPGIDPEATPACVNACISNALQFGDVEDPNSNVSTLLTENHHFRMHEELGTGPGIFYLWDKAGGEAPAPDMKMVADPIGAAQISPQHQTAWDWRASANFIFGGAGTGLMIASAIAGLFGINTQIPVLAAMMLIGLGLLCVFAEISRPLRFINVLFNARTSWMTREALAAMPLFGAGLLSVWFNSAALGVVAGLGALAFLYAQSRILLATKGIPSWRQAQIVPLIVSTGLTEGLGLFAIYGIFAGFSAPLTTWLALLLLGLIGLRAFTWHSYRKALGQTGAPTKTFEVLDNTVFKLTAAHQAIPAALVAASLFAGPVALAIGAALALAAGWLFKFTLITKAAHNQGYAINHMPARGAGDTAPGFKPGWTNS